MPTDRASGPWTGVRQWPRGIAASTQLDGYTLVSEGELQAQLIGQPVIETLERRFSDVLDTIDSRLWSLAASMGASSRPTNPFAPRVLVEATLATFPVEECDQVLRQLMLRQYERLCGDRSATSTPGSRSSCRCAMPCRGQR